MMTEDELSVISYQLSVEAPALMNRCRISVNGLHAKRADN
jgi:hypothetical protein